MDLLLKSDDFLLNSDDFLLKGDDFLLNCDDFIIKNRNHELGAIGGVGLRFVFTMMMFVLKMMILN